MIFIFIKFFKKFKNKKNLDIAEDNIVDLEKDPKTDEYKPKE